MQQFLANLNSKYLLRGFFWIGVYLILVLAPIFVLLIGSMPEGRGFFREFSTALGYSALSMLGIQFILTARFRRATAPYGIDVIYYFHRYLSQVAFVLVFAHVAIIFLIKPRYVLYFINPLIGIWEGLTGLSAALMLSFILAISLWRRRFRLSYERWRILHGIFAVAIIITAMIHIEGTGYYLIIPWKRAIWTAYAIFWICLLIYVRIVKPWQMLKHPYKVIDIKKERGRAYTITLAPEGHKGLEFKPGQFAWLTIWNSPFAIEEHPFSFSSSALQKNKLEFTIKELGDFTSKIKYLRAGEKVYIDGPYGSFTIDRYLSKGYVFIAGGVGIAPIISMIKTIANRSDKSPLLLIYAAGRWDKLTFREELEDLKDKINLNIVYTLEEPPDDWTGETGYVTSELLSRHLPDNKREFHYFVCGPDLMMDLVEHNLYKLGVPFTQCHSERFNLV